MSEIDWKKQYTIASINRADLTEFGYTDEQIAELFTDEIMEEIAANMGESYHMNFGFWEDFKRAIHVVLKYSFAWSDDCPAALFVTDNPNEQRMEASVWEDGRISSTPFLTIASPRLELITAVLGVIGYARDKAEDTKASWIYRLHSNEVKMKPAEWLVKQFTNAQQPFLDWLATHVVDTASEILPADTTRGFPAPDRDADAIYMDAGDEENPYHSPMQFEVWQENDDLLGILQITDYVAGYDVFTWYRVPVASILVLANKEFRV